MRSSIYLAVLVATIALSPLDGFAATKKKTKKATSPAEPTRAEIYQYCKMLIKKHAGASTTVYRVRRLSTGKIVCYYAW